MKKWIIIFIPAFLLITTALAQTTFTGVIKDSLEAPVEGASVVIKGTNTFALTDEKGQFTIVSKKPLPFSILISSVGFKQQEFLVSSAQDAPIAITVLHNSDLHRFPTV